MRASRCPPGVICFENVSVALMILLIGMIVMFFYFNNFFKEQKQNGYNNEYNTLNSSMQLQGENVQYKKEPVFNLSDKINDVLMDPYQAPLRDNKYHPSDSSDIRGIPINISTQSVDTSYRQIGIVTRINGPETILPLMGRPLLVHRDKWNFYTMNDKNNMIKLPIIVNGKSGTSEYGVDNLYSGDSIYVEGYNEPFKVTVYDNVGMKYIPVL